MACWPQRSGMDVLSRRPPGGAGTAAPRAPAAPTAASPVAHAAGVGSVSPLPSAPREASSRGRAGTCRLLRPAQLPCAVPLAPVPRNLVRPRPAPTTWQLPRGPPLGTPRVVCVGSLNSRPPPASLTLQSPVLPFCLHALHERCAPSVPGLHPHVFIWALELCSPLCDFAHQT